MRRLLVALLIASPVLLGACGDDNPDALGDDPTKEECLDVTRTMLTRLEVPEGVDPSDGLDDEERAKTDEAIDAIGADLGVDLADDGPCSAATDDLTEAEFAVLVEGIDPMVIELLAAPTYQEFSETGDTIN
jgi:hypothetical protein